MSSSRPKDGYLKRLLQEDKVLVLIWQRNYAEFLFEAYDGRRSYGVASRIENRGSNLVHFTRPWQTIRRFPRNLVIARGICQILSRDTRHRSKDSAVLLCGTTTSSWVILMYTTEPSGKQKCPRIGVGGFALGLQGWWGGEEIHIPIAHTFE